MTELDYYKAPTQEIFDDIKSRCIEIWKTYDDQFGYASEKVNSIKDLTNIRDNCLSIVARFDTNNMRKLLKLIEPKSREWLIPFIQHEFEAEQELLNIGIEL